MNGLQKLKKTLSSVDMTQGKPYKSLLLFTIPLLIGNIFQQMYSIADGIILGNVVGDDALAAVSSSTGVFFLVMVVMIGISMGVGVIVAQYFGAKKREELSHTIGVAITITAIIGVVMMLLAPVVTRPVLQLMRTPEDVLDYSVRYMMVLMLGVLGLAYFNILSGILRGLGDTFSPLIYLGVASILNVVLNLIFIPSFGVMGAAMGTVLAQALTSILCLRRLMKMRHVFDMGFKYLVPKKVYVKQVLRLGLPTAASQAIFAIAMMVIQPLVNNFGATLLAANLIIMRIDGIVMMPNFSFGNAMTVFAGQNVGAGKLDRLSLGVKQCMIMATSIAAIIVTIILLFGHHIAGAFTDTQEVIDLSMRMLRILAIGYVIFAANMVFWGVIRGAGDAVTPLWCSVINTVFIRVPSAFLFVHFIGSPEALFFSLLMGWTTYAILGALVFRFGRWRSKGLIKKDG